MSLADWDVEFGALRETGQRCVGLFFLQRDHRPSNSPDTERWMYGPGARECKSQNGPEHQEAHCQPNRAVAQAQNSSGPFVNQRNAKVIQSAMTATVGALFSSQLPMVWYDNLTI